MRRITPHTTIALAALLTLGDHVRKRRLHVRLFQREVAELLGVSKEAVRGWERYQKPPEIRFDTVHTSGGLEIVAAARGIDP